MAIPSDAICVSASAKIAATNPIASVHQVLVGSFVVSPNTGTIYDVQYNTVCGITTDFIASHLIGRSLFTDVDQMVSCIQSRYFGDSRRAFISIIRSVSARLKEISERPSN